MRGRPDNGRRVSDAEQLEIRARMAAGGTHWETAAALGCSTQSLQRLLAKTDGLPLRTVARSSLRLSLCEREETSRGLKAGESYRAIARRLGRAPSTVSREVAAHGSRSGYRVWRAERRALQEARRPKATKLARCPRLREQVEGLLAQRWSPKQITHSLALDHSLDPEMRVSHETIYRSLFIQTRGSFRKDSRPFSAPAAPSGAREDARLAPGSCATWSRSQSVRAPWRANGGARPSCVGRAHNYAARAAAPHTHLGSGQGDG